MSSRRESHMTRGGLAPRRRFAAGRSVQAPIVLALAMLVSAPAWGIPITWDGGGGDNRWNTVANWNPNQVPTASDDVTINANVTVTVRNPGANAVARTLTLGSGATVAEQNNHTLAVTQGISVSTGNATLDIPFTAGSLSQTGTGTLTI